LRWLAAPLSTVRGKFSHAWQDGVFNHLVKNASMLFVSNSVVTVLRTVQVVWLARVLLVEGYGQLVLIQGFIALVNEFFDVNIGDMAVKFGSNYVVRQDPIRVASVVKLSFIIDLATGIIAFVSVVALADWAAQVFLHNAAQGELVVLYAIGLLVATVDTTSQAVLRLMDRFRWLSMSIAAIGLIEFAAVIIALSVWGDLRSVIVALIVKSTVNALINLALAIMALRSRFGLRAVIMAPVTAVKTEYRAIFRFIWHTNVSMYLRMLSSRADVLILGYFQNSQAAGFYRLARQIGSMLVRVSDPVAAAILPDLSRMWAQGQFAAYRQLLRRLTLLMAGLLAPVSVGLFLVSSIVVRWLAQDSPPPGAGVLAACIMSHYLSAVTFWAGPAAISMQRPQYKAWVGALSVGVQTVGAVLLVPVWGALGSALALLTHNVIGQPLAVGLVRRSLAKAEFQLASQTGPVGA
jgi:O-antigen/teichoic acid export membrane protein